MKLHTTLIFTLLLKGENSIQAKNFCRFLSWWKTRWWQLKYFFKRPQIPNGEPFIPFYDCILGGNRLTSHRLGKLCSNYFLGWWFQIFFMFTPKTGEDEPILTTNIFFRWVGSTTNQKTTNELTILNTWGNQPALKACKFLPSEVHLLILHDPDDLLRWTCTLIGCSFYYFIDGNFKSQRVPKIRS